MIFQPKLLWYAKKLTHCFQCVSLKYFFLYYLFSSVSVVNIEWNPF